MLLTTTALLAASGLGSSDVLAAEYCGELEIPEEHDGDNVILVGESTGPELFGGAIVLGRGMAAVCYMDADGGWHFREMPDCRFSTSADKPLRIAAGAGDDVVMPVVRQDPRYDFVCPSSPRERMYPFFNYPGDVLAGEGCRDPNGCSLFPFGLKVEGGPGVDELHGTPNDDRLESNAVRELCWSPTGDEVLCLPWTPAADEASDTLCGYNGEDFLYGDPGPARMWAECLDGGPGEDYCEGYDADYDDSPVNTCESLGGAAEVTSLFIAPTAGECCIADGAPGCAPAYAPRDTQNGVCDADPYCCETAWDDLCVAQVESLGFGTCDGWLIHEEPCSPCGVQVADCLYDQTYVIPPFLDVLFTRVSLSPEVYLAPQTRGELECG